jgi:dTDP-4-amino-4,6-dideoxygalactose transaminase
MYRFGKEEIQAATEAMESGRLFRYMDEETSRVRRFEERFAHRMGSRHAILMSSGTAALMSGLVGLGIGPGDEVLIPGYTFIATALAVLGVGAVPVLCEIDESLTLDPEDLERKVSSRTRAVLPVHMNGLPSNMTQILQVARDHELPILEDACQALGGTFLGHMLGTFGDASAFSFNQFKILTAGGGGALITSQSHLHDRAFIFHDGACGVGRDDSSFSVPTFAGMPFRGGEITAAILLAQLEKLDGILKDLRAAKRRLAAQCEERLHLKAIAGNDPEGDCGTCIAWILHSQSDARKLVDISNGSGFDVYPAAGSLHLFSKWNCLLAGRGGHHPERNPLINQQERRLADSCPRTYELIQRTVILAVDIDADEKQDARFCKHVEKRWL